MNDTINRTMNNAKKLIIVSNRLPVTVEKKKGEIHFRQSAGGLATGLGSFYRSYNSIWVGWCGISPDRVNEEERKNIKTKLANDFNCSPIFLSKKDVDMYYRGFCNRTIWPIFHYFPQYAVYDKNLWESYRHVNRFFSDAVIKVAKPDDTIWIHDYHLMLLPELLREKLPNASIGFFLHIPFPSFEVFRLIPWRKEILNGLFGADLIGFHTYDYVRHFLTSTYRLLGYEQTYGQIIVGNRVVKVDAFPMGIDYTKFEKATLNQKVQREANNVRKNVTDRRVVLSVDRLDYTKGVLQKLDAFSLFLEKNPKYKEKIIFILLVVPSRTKVEHYRLLKKQIDESVGEVNGKYGTLDWMPIWYLYRSLPFHRLVSLYSISDIALITSLRDGMNLVAKEFIATKRNGHGVLILSEMTGAAEELGEAIIVNPNNREEVAEALKKAMKMPIKEQINHNRIMQKRLQRYNVVRWASDFTDSLYKVKELQHKLYAKVLTPEMRDKLINAYINSDSRLILLDYDGTLVPFTGKPEEAKPDGKLIKMLKTLTYDTRNNIVIISGREKETLEKWFGKLNIGLVAEHGAWVKEKNWEMIAPLRNDWKRKIRPVLEFYVDRTPGSFIEEKEFSLVWHYRKVNTELAFTRARELKDALLHLTANLGLNVLEGNKVIEIKNIGVNKGRAALKWIPMKDWDFIFAVGDDLTDEDIFTILPKSAYSIKVGLGISQARFNVESLKDIRLLLKQFEKAEK